MPNPTDAKKNSSRQKTTSPKSENASEKEVIRQLAQRPRRLRRSDGLRAITAETHLCATQFILPVFAVEGRNRREELKTLVGHYRMSPDCIVQEMEKAWQEGIRAVLIFGLPQSKDPFGTQAANPKGAAQQAVRALKKSMPELVLMADVCLCAYTTHGHCGVIGESGEVQNDASLVQLERAAVSLGEAGADLVAPSDMMDGRVGSIRTALDRAGLSEVGIMAYSAKYASAFYGPFRECVDSTPKFGDRLSYQMNPANRREALREAKLDAEEGADILMVKPALAYLDVISDLRAALDRPIAAYNVSGEYAMIKAAAERGWLEEKAAVKETLTAISRAGADLIITYHARDAARWLSE